MRNIIVDPHITINEYITYFPATKVLLVRWTPMEADPAFYHLTGLLDSQEHHLGWYGCVIDPKSTKLVLIDVIEGELVNLIKTTSIQVHLLPFLASIFKEVSVINGGFYLETSIKELKQRLPGLDNLTFMCNTYEQLLYRTQNYYNLGYYRLPKNEYPKNKHFIMMNAVPKYHRGYVIDRMMQERLINTMNYSWLKRNYQHTEIFNQYSLFDPNKIKNLDVSTQKIESHPSAQETLPTQYHMSLIDTFCESTCDSTVDVFVTEKTFKPLIVGKPFIGFGPANYNRTLKLMGFKLYENLFDYSHDKITDTMERMEAFLENNLFRIARMPLWEIEHLINTHKDDIEHNANLARTFDRGRTPLDRYWDTLHYLRN